MYDQNAVSVAPWRRNRTSLRVIPGSNPWWGRQKVISYPQALRGSGVAPGVGVDAACYSALSCSGQDACRIVGLLS